MSEMSTNLHDAAADARRQPDPTPEELALGRAALRFASADRAVRKHCGPRAGDEYDTKVARWREAYAELLQVAADYEQEGDHGG